MKVFDTSPGAGSYIEGLSLNCEPFAESIDDRFFYAGTTLMQRLDLLSHLTQFGDSVILVSGPDGSGKTTLLSRFVSQASGQWHMCLMDADEFDRFPLCLAEALKSEAAASEEELVSQWAARTDNSQLLVIVIDNSEQLDDTAFQRLCVLLGQPTANRTRLILFGSPKSQQDRKKAFEQKQPDCTPQLLEMPRMSEEETASYLVYRLAVAGYSGENPFTATEIRAICKASDGRPWDINRLARQALLERQARSESKRVRVRHNVRKISNQRWGLVATGILLLAVWLGWETLYPDPSDKVPAAAQPPMENRPLTIPERVPLAAQVETTPAPVETTVGPEPQANVQKREQSEPHTVPLATTAQSRPGSLTTELAVAGPTTETPSTTDVIRDTSRAETTGQAPVHPVKATPEPAPIAVNKDIVQPPVDSAGPETATEPVPTTEDLPHRENWLLAQPETSYTLQLLGSRNAESIAGHIQRHHLDIRQSAVYKGMHKGTEWYVLLFGIYPSRQAAIDARTTLPEAVRSENPWPRSLKSVHGAIQEVQ